MDSQYIIERTQRIIGLLRETRVRHVLVSVQVADDGWSRHTKPNSLHEAANAEFERNAERFNNV